MHIEHEGAYEAAIKRNIMANARKTWERNTPDHAEIADYLRAFIDQNGEYKYNFGGKLAASLFRDYGKLTEKQSDAVRKMIATAAERKAAAIKAIEEQRARSEWLGVQNERIEIAVKVDKIVHVEVRPFNYYDSGIMSIYLMRDLNGNRIVYKTKSSLIHTNEQGIRHDIADKDQIVIKASIKCHTEYRGEKQTIVQRVKVVSVTNNKT
jgi:hypothetical protein